MRNFPRSAGLVVLLACVVAIAVAAPELADQARPPRAGSSGTEPSPPPSPSPEPEPEPEPEPIAITGRERLAWEFDAHSEEQITTLGFTAFVDAEVFHLHDFVCHPLDGALALTCSAPLPPMSYGTHTIRVSAFVDDNIHGLQSPPIRVRLEPSSDETPNPIRRDLPFTTLDGIALRSQVVAEGFVDPTDLAILPDGRALIAERAGRVRIFSDEQLLPASSVSLSDLTTGDGRGLLALTIDAAFEKTRAVFALYTASSGARLVRFTLQGNNLDAHAVLLDGLPLAPSRPAASLRMGPDFRLYLGLDDGGEARRAGDLGSYSGKVLRLEPDGTTPMDQAGGSPVFVSEMFRPVGLAWQRAQPTSTWIVTRQDDNSERLYTVSSEETPRRAQVVASQTLPQNTGASDLVIYDSPAIPGLRGDHLIAAEGAKAILRLDPQASTVAIEWLLRDAIGPVTALAVAPDGSIYVLAGTRLLRISP